MSERSPSAAKERREVAWLVERGQPERQSPTVWRIAGPKPDYRAGEQWTEVAFKATRYATREEAQAVVDALFTGPSSRLPDNVTARATEHVFIGADSGCGLS